ncbi:hypothetical protein J1TS3_25110 [Siminovitchia fordii]|uniref:Uncharacterized protein n=1 Tax=Siminovitchia fordii TaxID=254759 RepID=A0ABQ4K833_9BACI|nr:hypothetical protein J1TS3_25110 [Siminovitchia fordii]
MYQSKVVKPIPVGERVKMLRKWDVTVNDVDFEDERDAVDIVLKWRKICKRGTLLT